MQSISTESLLAFSGLIRELTGVVKDISLIENEKAQAVSLYRHSQLDVCIRKEQASILKLKGLESKRLHFMEEHGWNNRSFREILELLPEDQSRLLSPFFDELHRAMEELTHSRQSSERILNIRLRNFEAFLEQERRKDIKEKNSHEHMEATHDQYV